MYGRRLRKSKRRARTNEAASGGFPHPRHTSPARIDVHGGTSRKYRFFSGYIDPLSQFDDPSSLRASYIVESVSRQSPYSYRPILVLRMPPRRSGRGRAGPAGGPPGPAAGRGGAPALGPAAGHGPQVPAQHVQAVGVRRPPPGISGRRIMVTTNHYAVDMATGKIHHYDGLY